MTKRTGTPPSLLAFPLLGSNADEVAAEAVALAHEQASRAERAEAVIAGLMTPAEHRAMELTTDLYRVLADPVIGSGPTREADLREAVAHIHAIQHTVLRQAAARAYPDRYRLLGEA